MKTNNFLPILFVLIYTFCTAQSVVQQNTGCRDDLWNHVLTEAYDQSEGAHGEHRVHSLITVAVCCTIRGSVVAERNTRGYSDFDGDYNFTMVLDDGMETVLNNLITANPKAVEAIRYYAGNATGYPPSIRKNQRFKCEIICEDPTEYSDDPLIVERCNGCFVVNRYRPNHTSMIEIDNHLEVIGRFIWDGSHFEIHPVSLITEL